MNAELLGYELPTTPGTYILTMGDGTPDPKTGDDGTEEIVVKKKRGHLVFESEFCQGDWFPIEDLAKGEKYAIRKVC